MIRRPWLFGLVAAVALAVACGAGRSFRLKFTGPTNDADDPDVARVARVDVEIFDGQSCTCAELDQKAGCMTADRVATLAFTPDTGQRTAGGFPEGSLVLRISAYDAASTVIPLKIDCWCAREDVNLEGGVLTLPIGSPRVLDGAGCKL